MVKIIFDDIYHWYNKPRTSDSCWFTSKKALPEGTVRCIRGQLFYSRVQYDPGAIYIGLSPAKITAWFPVLACNEQQRQEFKERL